MQHSHNVRALSLIHFLDTLQEFFQYDEIWILFSQSLQSDKQLSRYWFHQMALRFEYFCLWDCHDLLLEGLNRSRARDFPIGLISLDWSRSQRNIWKNHKVIQKEFRYFPPSTRNKVSMSHIIWAIIITWGRVFINIGSALSEVCKFISGASFWMTGSIGGLRVWQKCTTKRLKL